MTNICKVEGCGKPVFGNDYCNMHYSRLRRNNTLELIEIVERICKVAWCDQPHKAKGYCSMHYEQVRRKGKIIPQEEQRQMDHPETCSIPGCGEPYHAKGHCFPHYKQFRKNGKITNNVIQDPSYVSQTGKCEIEGCEETHHAKGLCKPHYESLKKQLAVEYKGGKCSVCGYDTCLSALVFHHKDSSEKENLVTYLLSCSLERAKPEIDKCILLCANCHAEVHNEGKFDLRKIDINFVRERMKI